MSQVTEEMKMKAEVYYGDAVCREKSKLLLQEVGLPLGLLPLKDIVEVGYVRETGFVWLKQKKKIEHVFRKIGKLVSYSPEITARVEKGRIKNLVGVKSKELLLWITIAEIAASDVSAAAAPASGEKLTFKSAAGLFRTFPAEAFDLEDGGVVTAASAVDVSVDFVGDAALEVDVGEAKKEEAAEVVKA